MNRKPLIVIFLTVLVDLIGFGIVIPLNPYLAREFGADPFQVGLLMAIYSLMQFLFNPFWGQLSDKYGRRPIILISLLGASLAHFWFAMSTDYWELFASRTLAGLFGANISTAMAYVADVTPPKERSKGMGLIGAAFGLGFVLGPFIGGIFGNLGEKLGDAPPFGPSFAAVVAALICFGNFLFAIKVLRESRVVAKEQGQTADFKQKRPRFQLLMRQLQRPVVGRLMVIYFLSSFAMAHMEASLFLFVQDEFRWNLPQASFGFAYVGLVMVFTQGYLIRKTLPKLGERFLMVVGFFLSAVGLAGIGISYDVWVLAVFVTLLGVGIGLANPAVTGSISLLTPAQEQGGTLGVNQSLSALGRIIGPVIGGWLYRDYGYSSPFFAAGFLASIGLMIAILTWADLPQTGKTEVA